MVNSMMVFVAMVQILPSILKLFSDELSSSNFDDDSMVCITRRLDLFILDGSAGASQTSYARGNLELSTAELSLFQYSTIKKIQQQTGNKPILIRTELRLSNDTTFNQGCEKGRIQCCA